MSELSVGTTFENSIELIGGQRFPDIIAKRFFGVEVKSTTQDHWKTTGNSVLESTRVEDVNRIYLLFGKFGGEVEFRYRPYEEVLSEVVVTHSPRYLIDMNLGKGSTIFDKLGLAYDKLRVSDNPINEIVEHYKRHLKPGEDLWWINNGSNSHSSNIVVKIWDNLSKEEKNDYRAKSMAFFPELFGPSSHKFVRLAIWLATQEAIVCPNIRDQFTAGGRKEYYYNNKNISIPKSLFNLLEALSLVFQVIYETPAEELSQYWEAKTNESKKHHDWISHFLKHFLTLKSAPEIDIENLLFQKYTDWQNAM